MGLIIVVGPPAGGKSTWTRAHAKRGDIVIDYDLLATALTAPGASPHDHERHVKSVAFRARSAAIDEALRHTGACDVYVIHSSPRPEAMAKYARHGARVVTIDPGQDVVLARCEEQRPASAIAVAMRWYSEHGDTEFMIARTSRDW